MADSDGTTISSYLVRSLQGQMLMVRYLFNPDLAQDGGYSQAEMFVSCRWPSRMEVFEVDLGRRRLVPRSGVGGDRAVFVGTAHTVMASTDRFPKIAANAVYLSYFLQRRHHFGVYRFEDGTVTPARELRAGADGGFTPCAFHWELDDYLICDVQKGYAGLGVFTSSLITE